MSHVVITSKHPQHRAPQGPGARGQGHIDLHRGGVFMGWIPGNDNDLRSFVLPKASVGTDLIRTHLINVLWE